MLDERWVFPFLPSRPNRPPGISQSLVSVIHTEEGAMTRATDETRDGSTREEGRGDPAKTTKDNRITWFEWKRSMLSHIHAWLFLATSICQWLRKVLKSDQTCLYKYVFHANHFTYKSNLVFYKWPKKDNFSKHINVLLSEKTAVCLLLDSFEKKKSHLTIEANKQKVKVKKKNLLIGWSTILMDEWIKADNYNNN